MVSKECVLDPTISANGLREVFVPAAPIWCPWHIVIICKACLVMDLTVDLGFSPRLNLSVEFKQKAKSVTDRL